MSSNFYYNNSIIERKLLVLSSKYNNFHKKNWALDVRPIAHPLRRACKRSGTQVNFVGLIGWFNGSWVRSSSWSRSVWLSHAEIKGLYPCSKRCTTENGQVDQVYRRYEISMCMFVFLIINRCYFPFVFSPFVHQNSEASAYSICCNYVRVCVVCVFSRACANSNGHSKWEKAECGELLCKVHSHS